MARYNLIMTDDHYVKLVDRALRENKSVGRLVNDAVKLFLEGPAKPVFLEGPAKPEEIKACFLCGGSPALEVHGFGSRALYFCTLHGFMKKHFNLGFKDLPQLQEAKP